MGLFTQSCTQCHNPLLAYFNVEMINKWMSQGVSITQEGILVTGVYDGYGTLVTDDEDEIRCVGNHFDPDGGFAGTGPTVWHQVCWRIAGSPTKWQGESDYSPDQGHFFVDGTYHIPEPETAEDVASAAVATRAWREEIGQETGSA